MKWSLAITAVTVLAFTTYAQAAQRSVPDRDAQSYPSKPIRVMVPQAPGGSNDIMARYIGGQLGERLGRQVVVDNRAGAEGMIATDIVAKANPDGYTILMASTAFTMNPAVVKKLPYDPVKDFDWVAMFGRAPVIITVGQSLPVNTLQELIALGKSKPNYFTMASAGGFMHFASAMFRSHAGFKAEIALYKGGAPALIDVISGQAHLATATAVTASPQIRSGRLKALAVSSAKRLATFPDVPTAAEAGLPSYDATIWWGWATTAGTPPAILNKLYTEIAAILQAPETARRFATESAEVEMHTPAEMRTMIPADLAKWEKVAREAGMQKQ
ncbi:MAG TPA: tripartite tricarboxylate transporter substrate binding protein [Burkholderiales bacterium]|nr:tripartite tricarboxylate transporter substrate binding protein [Burkholderiales bacterium]